jgi:sec-independent protein translocase protein TatA
MLGLTPAHLLIILVIALIVIGPGKLPEVGAALGKSIREFQKAAGQIQDPLRAAPPAPPVQPMQPMQPMPPAQSYYAAPPVYPVTAYPPAHSDQPQYGAPQPPVTEVAQTTPAQPPAAPGNE